MILHCSLSIYKKIKLGKATSKLKELNLKMPSNHVSLTQYFAQNATSRGHPVGPFNEIIFYQSFAIYFPHTQVCYLLEPIALRILNT